MPFQKDNQHGKTSKRGKDKLKKELKEKLKQHVETVIDSLDVDSYTENQKLKYLSTVLPYIIPKKKEVAIDTVDEDFPLFVDTREDALRLLRMTENGAEQVGGSIEFVE